ncbi:MAG: hypothetical protein DRJ10_09585, partial [Bacteroidetes bacterium]
MKSTKLSILLLLVLFLSIQIHAQSINKENKLIYYADEFENGKFLKDFMLIGPFPNLQPEGTGTYYFHLEHTCLGFSKDYLASIGGEENMKPFIGQTVEYEAGKSLKWEKIHSPTDKIDLKKIFIPNDKVVCYAAIYINSDKAQEKLMGIGSNDGMKVWLNGEMLIK